MITTKELRRELYEVEQKAKRDEAIRDINYRLDRMIINTKYIVNITQLIEKEDRYISYSVFEKFDGYYYTIVSYKKEYPNNIISERIYYHYNIPKKHTKKLQKLQSILEFSSK